ncbi:hypothetical protein MUK51_17715 [Sphingobacterium faecium]|uniref:hypothetical protein n=1 Tax=Sphingobacterium faecium TaxID=34087 RepID=UPI0021B65318|nr:hypothetical protein [Sphingobacterium faecium]UXD69022.1 hypothetical protein MUK51_17715 [Sphingobacterium faecium]
MDELDQFKKQWQEDENFIKVDQTDIKTMLHKSSTSIVKWIFMISLIELSLGIILSLLLPSSNRDELPFFHFVDYASEVVFYCAIAYFIYNFFKSYTNISSTSSTKNLLSRILETRKHVENYIKFNIYFIMYSFFISFVELAIRKINLANQWGANFLKVIAIAVLITLVACLFISIFKFYYKIVYRRLLKKLNNNYEELTRLEQE